MSEIVGLRKVAAWAELDLGTWCNMHKGPPWVRCPECGVRGALTDHSIAADGSISPSLVCPAGCGWHVFARLLGWEA